MDLTPLIPAGRQIIESYGGGRFKVSGSVFAGGVLVFPARTLEWPVADAAAISAESLDPVIREGRSGTVDLLLLGYGRRMAPMPAALRKDLRDAGIVIEAMDTGAACRTYNMLMADGRRVAAAVIAID